MRQRFAHMLWFALVGLALVHPTASGGGLAGDRPATRRTLRRHGIRVVELGDSAYDGIAIIRALQRQEVVAVLGDRVFADRAGSTT